MINFSAAESYTAITWHDNNCLSTACTTASGPLAASLEYLTIHHPTILLAALTNCIRFAPGFSSWSCFHRVRTVHVAYFAAITVKSSSRSKQCKNLLDSLRLYGVAVCIKTTLPLVTAHSIYAVNIQRIISCINYKMYKYTQHKYH